MKEVTARICIFLVVLFYAVGYFGFTHPQYSQDFRLLVPFHLLLMLGLMIVSQEDKNKDFWVFLITTYVAGFVIELLGVNTGRIFGEYVCGNTLGPKFADIPLLIGVNWILVIYSVGIVVRSFQIRHHIIRAIIGAFLVTALDFLIEPVAIKYDYWSWKNYEVPFQNYVGWFVFSYIMLKFFYLMKFKKNNKAAIVLFIVQFVFFFFLSIKSL